MASLGVTVDHLITAASCVLLSITGYTTELEAKQMCQLLTFTNGWTALFTLTFRNYP